MRLFPVMGGTVCKSRFIWDRASASPCGWSILADTEGVYREDILAEGNQG